MSNYPHIDNYYKNISELLGEPVDIFEKIDGSNFSILARPGNGYQYLSKNQVIFDSQEGAKWDFGMFGNAVKLADRIVQDIQKYASSTDSHGILQVFFEFFGKGINKRIKYDHYLEGLEFQENNKSLMLIDACWLNDPKEWFTCKELKKLAWQFKLLVPMVKDYQFDSLSLLDVQWMRESRGTFAVSPPDSHIEGWVIRQRDRKLNQYGELIQTKVKTDWYESYENRGGEKTVKIKDKVPTEILDFVSQTVNFGRLNSVYSHGHPELKREMADMKVLPGFVFQDIKEETKDNPIWTQFDEDSVRKVLNKTIPVTLKKWLAENVTA